MIEIHDSEKEILNMSIILAHAPREEEDKEKENAFYDHLKRLYVEAVQSLYIWTLEILMCR